MRREGWEPPHGADRRPIGTAPRRLKRGTASHSRRPSPSHQAQVRGGHQDEQSGIAARGHTDSGELGHRMGFPEPVISRTRQPLGDGRQLWKWRVRLRLVPVGDARPVVAPVVAMPVPALDPDALAEWDRVLDVEPVDRPLGSLLLRRPPGQRSGQGRVRGRCARPCGCTCPARRTPRQSLREQPQGSVKHGPMAVVGLK